MLLDVSCAKAAGLRNGVSAPYSFAMDAISSLSVVTMTSSIYRLFSEASIVYAIMGLSPSGLMFLPGMPFDPPRAGMIATISCVLYIDGSFLLNLHVV